MSDKVTIKAKYFCSCYIKLHEGDCKLFTYVGVTQAQAFTFPFFYTTIINNDNGKGDSIYEEKSRPNAPSCKNENCSSSC